MTIFKFAKRDGKTQCTSWIEFLVLFSISTYKWSDKTCQSKLRTSLWNYMIADLIANWNDNGTTDGEF